MWAYILLNSSPKERLLVHPETSSDSVFSQQPQLSCYPHAGLREIQVSTVEEAMLLLRYGLRHRSQAATRLNYSSSRSHAVYTVKLVKVVNPDKPANALVNR